MDSSDTPAANDIPRSASPGVSWALQNRSTFLGIVFAGHRRHYLSWTSTKPTPSPVAWDTHSTNSCRFILLVIRCAPFVLFQSGSSWPRFGCLSFSNPYRPCDLVFIVVFIFDFSELSASFIYSSGLRAKLKMHIFVLSIPLVLRLVASVNRTWHLHSELMLHFLIPMVELLIHVVFFL